MRRNTLLAAAIAAMTMVLMAGRCSSDEDAKSSAVGPAAQGASDGGGRVDGGVEKDPLDGTMGESGTVDDDNVGAGASDVSLDDPAPGEPQPVPEEGPSR